MKKLTIGSAVYDDFDGVYFTYQSLRLNTQHVAQELEFIIIDNNPQSAQGKATKHFCEATGCIKYIPFEEITSTAIRNQIFKNAQGEFCMSIDPHVLFEPSTIEKLLKFLSEHSGSKDLFHGPMIYDGLDHSSLVTHMDPVWRDNMFGIWSHQDSANLGDEPFEIPMHGLGVFLTKTKEWLGFNKKFEGFGGEEGYIHQKYLQSGRRVWCLPFLKWLHRFDRPAGIPYPNIIEDRIRNYIIGRLELNLPLDDVVTHFKETNPHIDIDRMVSDLSAPKMRAWNDSVIKFTTPSLFRYIKYEILESYDGHGALQQCKVTPTPPAFPKIISVSSECATAKASSFLRPEGSWQSHPNAKDKFPHSIIIDFSQPIEMTKILTSSRPGLQLGMPTKFKVYVSNDLDQWHEVSNVNVFEKETVNVPNSKC